MRASKPSLHGRDHCPGGADPIPCLGTAVAHSAIAEFTSQSVSSPGTTLAWDHFYTDDATFFGTETNSPGDTQITLLQDVTGIWIATLQLHVNNVLNQWNGFLSVNGFGNGTAGQIEVTNVQKNAQNARIQTWGGNLGGYWDATIYPTAGGTDTIDSGRLVVFFLSIDENVDIVY